MFPLNIFRGVRERETELAKPVKVIDHAANYIRWRRSKTRSLIFGRSLLVLTRSWTFARRRVRVLEHAGKKIVIRLGAFRLGVRDGIGIRILGLFLILLLLFPPFLLSFLLLRVEQLQHLL